MDDFICLRYLDLSNNKFTDLKQISNIISLRELNISNNFITNLNFLNNLTSLEVLKASNNKINDIKEKMPINLIDVDLSENQFNSLEFIQNSFSDQIRHLDLSGNNINEIRSLRFIAVLTQIKVFQIDLLEKNKDLLLIQFVKHLCPSIEEFDGSDCSLIPETNLFNSENLIDILVNGTENQLKIFLKSKDPIIKWDEPVFVQFDVDVPQTPLKGIEERLRVIETKIPDESDNNNDNLYKDLKDEINILRQQITKMAEILFVHDKAMKKLWEDKFE